MKYFNGFSLQGEEALFVDFLIDTDMAVAGFSYGAQQALEYAYASTERIDRLILLSPAFFETQKPSFVRAQLRYFEADRDAYVAQFLKNVAYPSAFDLSPYLKVGSAEELETLLTYRWDTEKIDALLARGITIELFVGAEDKIVDTAEVRRFFTKTVNYVLRDAGHILQEDS